MLNLTERIALLTRLGVYMKSQEEEWLAAQHRAHIANAWFTPEFIAVAISGIADDFLQKEGLIDWCEQYKVVDNPETYNVGIIMAGNIPLVGFHDFLCVFVAGHKQTIKLSSKDNILLQHLINKMYEWAPDTRTTIQVAELLKGCDAYIATGSNNSSRYFDYYFRNNPHIIRKNRTSVAVLHGSESTEALEKLADDVYTYFGMGCRNVTQLFVPVGYDFLPLLEAFRKYDYLIENHKYKHNYDYGLALQMINQQYYMTNGSIILSENASSFSPVSQLHYQFYQQIEDVYRQLNPEEIQCIAGTPKVPLGAAQHPGLSDYADGVDTMTFLTSLHSSVRL